MSTCDGTCGINCAKCAGVRTLQDTQARITLTREHCEKTVKCVPVTTIEWQKKQEKSFKTKCEQVPVPDEKCLTVKTTKCKKIMKKVPVEKVRWEKKCTPVKKEIKKAVIVPCTKTITVPSSRVEYRTECVTEDKIEWIKKCYTDYEMVSDYECEDCEEKIKVPTWKLEEKEVKVCQEETTWEGKEVATNKYVKVNKPVEKCYDASIPVKKLVTTHTVGCTCAEPRPKCYRAHHQMICGSCRKPREQQKPVASRKSSSSSSSCSSSDVQVPTKSLPPAPPVRKTCTNPNCTVCKSRIPQRNTTGNSSRYRRYAGGVNVSYRGYNSDGDDCDTCKYPSMLV